MREVKNDTVVKVRLPQHVKESFREMCEDDFIDMSVKLRQIIMKELKEKGYVTENTTKRTGSNKSV